MKEINVENRLSYLAELFDVFKLNELNIKITDLVSSGFEVKVIEGNKIGSILGLISTKSTNSERHIKKVSICDEIFIEMLKADPTSNKSCLQWMLNLFSRLLKDGTLENRASALRLVEEDLPQANEYLDLFEKNKNKKKFKELAKSNYSLKHVIDHSDINQYKSLGQLFESVDPFIIKNPIGVEKLLLKFVESGQAVIPVRDRKYTLFIPKTRDASIIFDKFANWCTAKPDNGMFKRYTEDYKKPNKAPSNIYIIINNKFFSNESDELYQIHFESNQIKDKRNESNVNIYENVLSNSEGLSNFFYEELMAMAKDSKSGIDNNKYLDYLISFGFSESLFEFMDENSPMIRFTKKKIPKLPDLSKFKALDSLIIVDAGLTYIHPSIGNLKNISMISLNQNNIKAFPKEIGNLKKLEFLSFVGNKSQVEIPEEIKYLDPSNGGKLFMISVKVEEIGQVNYDNLRRWLPNVRF